MSVPRELEARVKERAGDRCEYCLMHQALQGASFHVEHVMPQSRGGETSLRNLALACPGCNLHKADRVEAVDPDTGAPAPLFNPRSDRWEQHFRFDGFAIRGLTAVGRATIECLDLNHPAVIKSAGPRRCLACSRRTACERMNSSSLKIGWLALLILCAGVLTATAAVTGIHPDGSTPLHWAVHQDDLTKVKTLLAAGADAKATNNYGVPPLHLACVNGNEAIVNALLDAGADANTTLRGGETVLHTAARTGRGGPVKALLGRGAKVDATDRKGQTALMWAAADGNTEVVELLLKSGADRYARLRSGFTALLFAAREGRIGVVRALLKAGADANESIETENKGGGTAPENRTSALLLAVENGHFELALELVKAGANPNDMRTGYAPLHVLSWVRRPNRGDDADGQPPPQGSGNVTSLQFVRELVKLGANVNARVPRGTTGTGKFTKAGATPFLLASRTADLPLMKLLVELGADPSLPNKDGATPLMGAAGLGCLAPTEEAGTEAECLEAVQYLLSLGADVNTVDANGDTAMHGAAYKSLPKMVELLASKGAKIEVWNRKNKSGWTPVLIAEGFRFGNFKPAPDTLAALHRVMLAAGVQPPAPTPREKMERKGYDQP